MKELSIHQVENVNGAWVAAVVAVALVVAAIICSNDAT